ncbi:hypothetical protein, partial [Bacillus velezensis]|uniref:hypothetical protein n=1 Tax=Bacillus velezensis TaxID=492670 RepID=UPI001C92F318
KGGLKRGGKIFRRLCKWRKKEKKGSLWGGGCITWECGSRMRRGWGKGLGSLKGGWIDLNYKEW